MVKHTCPTCEGVGEVDIDIEENEDSKWYRGRGDKDLWEKYSHASIKSEGETWSKFFVIASFYRCRSACKDCGDYTLNLFGEGGSWPVMSSKRLKKQFRFIERKTGDEIAFRATKERGGAF